MLVSVSVGILNVLTMLKCVCFSAAVNKGVCTQCLFVFFVIGVLTVLTVLSNMFVQTTF